MKKKPKKFDDLMLMREKQRQDRRNSGWVLAFIGVTLGAYLIVVWMR